MRGYQEGDDLRRIHWPSVARTGELMIRQDESTRRSTAVLFVDTRDAAVGQTHTPSFEKVMPKNVIATVPADAAITLPIDTKADTRAASDA